MQKQKLVYEGKAKKLYETDEETVIWVEYLDQATALNGLRKDTVSGKGQMNNQITALIFEELTAKGIANHFLEKISKTEQLIRKVKMIPLEVVVRNVAAGSFTKRLAIAEGTVLPSPIIEFYYKNDTLDDPFINDEHIRFLEIASEAELKKIKKLALEVNNALKELFLEKNIRLIDFKIEVGRTAQGEILLADEISPDTCRLWDVTTNEHLDKDVYRREIGDLVPVYEEVLDRLQNKGVK